MTSRTGADAQADFRAVEPVMHPEGWALLNSLGPYREEDALTLSARLREQGHDSSLVSAVLTQARLRSRAQEKFGPFAQQMLFTPHGLEQATRWQVAALHAGRFARAGVASVADLGCGIGGDAMALAGLDREVLAIDRDEVTVAVATVNLRPFPQATVELGDALAHDPARTEGIWLDPARRRVNGARTRRLHDPEEYEPPLSAVEDLARRLGTDGAHGPVGAKLGPGIDPSALPAGTETQWLSWHGQVLEACCWFGPLATAGVQASALLADAQGMHRMERRGPRIDPDCGELGAHLYEPDGAVIRAGLLGELASRLQARTVDPTIAYLTSDVQVTTPFARGFTVRDVMPFSLKRLSSYLREHRIGIIEVKKRGTAVEPEELRRRLRPRRFGDASATLILTRLRGEQSVIIADPHPPAAEEKTA